MQKLPVQISRIHKLEGDSKLKAFVDISLAGLIVKGLRLIQGEKGLFLAMPKQQGKDGRWYSTVYPVDKETHQQLTRQVLAAYQQ